MPRGKAVRTTFLITCLAGCIPEAEPGSEGETPRSSQDCPADQLSCGKQTPVHSNGTNAFVNEEMGIRAVFPQGSEVCLARSGDAPRGYYTYRDPEVSGCSESASPKGYLSVAARFNATSDKTLTEASGHCGPVPSHIAKLIGNEGFSIPGHRVLACGETDAGGKMAVTLYTFGGGLENLGEGPVHRIVYFASFGTTERQAKEDVAAFRQFLGTLELAR